MIRFRAWGSGFRGIAAIILGSMLGSPSLGKCSRLRALDLNVFCGSALFPPPCCTKVSDASSDSKRGLAS